jgi:hypothetical protein
MIFYKTRIKRLEDNVSALRAQLSISLYQQGIIYSRKDFGYILNYLGLTNLGVEVGVRKGNYSEHLLSTWRGNTLYSVDPWEHFDDGEYVDKSNVRQKEQDSIYRIACKKLSPFKNRSVIMRSTSEDAAKAFGDNTLDFVYLDAQHHYDAVVRDIALWSPKLKSGGVLSGDDYINIQTDDNVFGVKDAVDEYVARNDLKLTLASDGLYPSWFLRIP